MLAQEDYVVTAANDTLLCKIQKALLGGYTYRTPENNTVKITTANTQSFSKNGAVFNVIRYKKDKPFFAERIISGRISLYEYSATMISGGNPVSNNFSVARSQSTIYAEKDGDIILIKWLGAVGTSSRKSRIDEFQQMIRDHKEIAEEFERKKNFSFNNIKELINRYNSDMADGRPD
ncbi:MAG: hypothetical protein INR69_04285 [Mucilaginibacter polytrichastri]|nr:hypothetical protein [Mucilaginibacter polytrichastri]